MPSTPHVRAIYNLQLNSEASLLPPTLSVTVASGRAGTVGSPRLSTDPVDDLVITMKRACVGCAASGLLLPQADHMPQ